MSRILLTLRYQHDRSVLTELLWSDGDVKIVSAVELVRADLEEIVRYGLSEWVGEAGEARPRTTLPREPLFLERLAAYFARQFDFLIELREEESKPREEEERMWSSFPRAKVTVS